MTMDTEYKTIDNNNKSGPYFWRQLYVCFITTLFYFMIGLTLGSPTVALPQLRKEANATTNESIERSSSINAIVPYVAIAWVFILIIAAHYFGRKKPMIFISLNSIVANTVFYHSKNYFQLFISQILQAVIQASYATICNMVVLEYTSPRYRGLFLGFFSATIYWGIWVANTIGLFSNYRYIGLVGIATAVYTFISTIFIPESPYWLACRGRYDECAKVHRWLKGTGEDAEIELSALINSCKNLKETTTKSGKRIIEFIFKYVQILKRKEMYKPILLVSTTALGSQLCGKLACAVYAVEIMKKITTTESEASIGVLILDGATVAGMYAGTFLTRYFRRRTLLIGSSVVCIVFLFLMSSYLFLVKYFIIIENSYVSVFLLVLYSLAACFVAVSVSQVEPELYPIKYRTFAMCILCVWCKIIFGSILKITPYIFMHFSESGAFLFFGISFTVCLIIWYHFIPETKDRTIQEISEMFAKGNIKDTKLLADNSG